MRFLSNILAKAGLIVDGVVTFNSVANSSIDTDKFLVIEAGEVKYRTGAQLASDIGATATTVRYTETFTATASQTVFTTVNTLVSGYFDVYVNGVRLNTSSFSSTSSSVTLVDGADVGDIVDIIILGVLAVYATLPSQTGNAGKYLTTDGTNLSWGTVTGGGSGTVTTVSIVSANGFAGTVADASTTPAITLSTTITGLLKGNGTAISAAVAGTDYQGPISLTTTGNSGAATFVANTLNIPTYTLAGLGGQPSSTNLTSLSSLSYVSTSFVKMTASGTFALDTNTYYLASNPNGYTTNTGTVTTLSVVSANGFAGTVATATTTPAITLTTTITGVLKGNGTAISAAVAGTDYQAPITLTTTGNSGAATFITNTLNIPTYTLAGLGGFTNPMTTLGDVIYGGVSGAATRLGGNTTTAKQYLSQTGNGSASAAPVWSAIAGADVTGAALTKTDDTNVTLTLGGTPTTALLRAASLTLGWTGQLSVARGGTGVGTLTGVVIGNGTSNMSAVSSTTPLQVLRVNAAGTGYEFATLSAGSGSVTSVSVVSANGFAGTVANASTTPAITLTTTVSGLLLGDGTAISAATDGTDYYSPTTLSAVGNIELVTSGPGKVVSLTNLLSVVNLDNTSSPYDLTHSTGPNSALVATEIVIYSCDATAGNIVINIQQLGIASTWPEKRLIIIKRTDETTNTVTINAGGTDTIDGGSSIVLRRQSSVTLYPVTLTNNWLIL